MLGAFFSPSLDAKPSTKIFLEDLAEGGGDKKSFNSFLTLRREKKVSLMREKRLQRGKGHCFVNESSKSITF